MCETETKVPFSEEKVLELVADVKSQRASAAIAQERLKTARQEALTANSNLDKARGALYKYLYDNGMVAYYRR